jgi:hypothetical protein
MTISAATPDLSGRTTDSFKYDPFGRRIEKSSSSGTSIYAYDGENLVEETNSSGGGVARYTQTFQIDEPLAELRSGTTSYYEADGLWSISSLSNAAGAIANNYTYDSFGRVADRLGLGAMGAASFAFSAKGVRVLNFLFWDKPFEAQGKPVEPADPEVVS